MSNNTPIRAVVFDLDGLMFNTEELYIQVGSEVLRRRDKEFSQELLDAMMGLRPRHAIALMIAWHQLDDTVGQIEAESQEIFVPLLDRSLQPMLGLMDLLKELESAGIPKAVGTSSGRDFVNNVLNRYNLLPRFQFILTAEDVIDGKPHPEIYWTAADRFGVAPEQILVFEDSQTGCRSAVAAGARVVAIPGSHSSHHDFSGADFIADSLADPRITELLALRAK